MSAPENNDHDIRVGPDRLESFASQCDTWADRLEKTREEVVNAARFTPPSADPASVRATYRLAVNGQEAEGSPVSQITKAINELRQQADTARQVAVSYRDTERANAERLRRKGLPD